MDLFCKNLHERLPELLWKLPFWPKGYQDYLPFGLFEKRTEFTPEIAVAEIAKHLHSLNQLEFDSAQARFLSQKIAQQVRALVEISKLIPPEKRQKLLPKGITREDYLAYLQERKIGLLIQEQALKKAHLREQVSQEVSLELQHIQQLIQEVDSAIKRI
jgi:hypothetical protein